MLYTFVIVEFRGHLLANLVHLLKVPLHLHSKPKDLVPKATHLHNYLHHCFFVVGLLDPLETVMEQDVHYLGYSKL